MVNEAMRYKRRLKLMVMPELEAHMENGLGSYLRSIEDQEAAEAESRDAEGVALTELLAAAGSMTAKRLQSIALNLGNGGWCRHWYMWGGMRDPWIMAIQVRNWDGAPIGITGMEEAGFVRHKDFLYLVKRCNEDGTPYVGG